MSQICALTAAVPSITVRVENSTPMVVRLSWLNSLRVNRDSRLVLPTPDSPISTTEEVERGELSQGRAALSLPELESLFNRKERSTEKQDGRGCGWPHCIGHLRGWGDGDRQMDTEGPEVFKAAAAKATESACGVGNRVTVTALGCSQGTCD